MHPSTALSFRAVVSVSSPTASPPEDISPVTVTALLTVGERAAAARRPLMMLMSLAHSLPCRSRFRQSRQ